MNLFELIQKVQTEQYPPIQESYSKELRDLVSKMLEKDHTKRITIKDINKSKIIIDSKTKNSFLKTTKSYENEFPKLEVYTNKIPKQPNGQKFHFPLDSKTTSIGILGFLSKIPISAFAEEIITKNKKKGNFMFFSISIICY